MAMCASPNSPAIDLQSRNDSDAITFFIVIVLGVAVPHLFGIAVRNNKDLGILAAEWRSQVSRLVEGRIWYATTRAHFQQNAPIVGSHRGTRLRLRTRELSTMRTTSTYSLSHSTR
jgi:hypothetical protein